jgi:uncharacterized membrane protein
MLLTPVLLWFHIFAAVGWLGSAMVFAMLIGPTIGTLTPGTRAELVVKLFPRYIRYVESFSIATVVFGVALVLVIGNGDMSVFSPSTSFGLYISIGAVLALITAGLAFGIIVPSAHRVIRLAEEMIKNPGPPSPELPKASARLRMGATVGLILLILVLIFMVAGTAG